MTQNSRSANDNAREHGGNVALAAAHYGVDDMIDLSTGISPRSYPAEAITVDMLQALPQQGMLDACLNAARKYYNVPRNLEIVAGPGTQALLQMAPLCVARDARGETGRSSNGARDVSGDVSVDVSVETVASGDETADGFEKSEPTNSCDIVETVWIRRPTYNEHRPAWRAAGYNAMGGDFLPDQARHAVIVAPNNPTGALDIEQISDVANEIRHRSGLLLIDGAFADGSLGADLLAQHGKNEAVVHLRSFGKFFGLAGLRLGFAIGTPDLINQMRLRAGPWAVNSAALQISTMALNDTKWIDAQHKWLQEQSCLLADLLIAQGMSLRGGTSLFQTIAHKDAHDIHHHLARSGIWTRIYGEHPELLRLGLPGSQDVWNKLEEALSNWRR